jgi:hypothetical protein
MKTNRTFLLIFFCCNSFFLSAQLKSDSLIKLNSQAEFTNREIEKVYLQLDRTYYRSGDNVWYKAYLVNALNTELSNNSKSLYVELISPELKILKRNVIRMENGTGFGDFLLKDSLPSGKYQIRAYTNWMRNFGDYFIFTKEIEIVNLREKNQTNKDSISGEISNNVDLQFFPEGGSLVEGLMSRVGFKATNANGKGCKVAGKLISSTGDTIASFESNPLGMGSFSFIPQNNISYHVVLLSPKAVLKENSFPSVMQMGYVLTIANYNDSTIIISVNTNEKTLKKYPEQKLTLTSEFRGKQLITATIKLKSTYGHYLLEKDKLPIGIVRFTIHDNQKRPWCERLYYIDKKDNVIINVSSDKESYSPHEKVNLVITVKDTTNKPVQANLSISATDAYLTGNKMQSENDIYSYFMLDSDIHGYVEQPSYYFDTVNPNRYIDLDLLLLTQGWRDFIWKHLTDTIIPLKYPNETGICISGELYTLLTHKPKSNTAISLGLKNENKAFFDNSITDSKGRYKFENLDFTDTSNVTVSAFKNKNKAAGEITINSLFSEPMQINPYNLLANYSLNENLSKVETDELIKHFYLTESGLPTIAIEEVDVIEEKVIKNDYLNPYYTEPDWSRQLAEVDFTYLNVFEYLLGRVAGVNIGKDRKGYKVSMRGITSINGGTVLLLLDGM